MQLHLDEVIAVEDEVGEVVQQLQMIIKILQKIQILLNQQIQILQRKILQR
jgi:hypothetical protein